MHTVLSDYSDYFSVLKRILTGSGSDGCCLWRTLGAVLYVGVMMYLCQFILLYSSTKRSSGYTEAEAKTHVELYVL